MDMYVLIAGVDDTHANEDSLGIVKYTYIQDTMSSSFQEPEGVQGFANKHIFSKYSPSLKLIFCIIIVL